MPIDKTAGPTALQWFLAELDRAQGCERTKGRVRQILRSMTGQRLFVTRRDLVQPERMREARALLDAGFTPTEARRELAARHGFGPRTAERLVAAALDERARQYIAAHQLALDLQGGNDDGAS
ncbi:MAG: hypothetical protein RLY71_2295 [Pseudomonadota bacterium]